MNLWASLAALFKRKRAGRRLYNAAKPSRLTSGWGTSTASADSELFSSLTALRARSRALVRDSPYARRARAIIVNNVVGSGIGLQAQVKNQRKRLLTQTNDAIEDAWREWCRADSCDTGGTLHFADIERVLIGEVFEAGEAFVRIHRRAFGQSKIPFALEVIEAERVPHDILPSAATLNARMGVEVDEFYRPQAYWIRNRHPSDLSLLAQADPERATRVPADEIIHLRIVTRWPQTRGEPWMCAVARKLNDMDGYTEAEIVAARGAANYLGAWEGTDGGFPTDAEKQEDGTYQTELSPGVILTPPPGMKLNMFNPNRPNSALDPFMRYMVREFCIGVGISYASGSGDYSQSNYSSSRLALLDDRDLWRALQDWFIRTFRERIHREWLAQAVIAKAVAPVGVEAYALQREKFEAVKFKPRGWSWIDPQSEVDAYEQAVKAGFMTRGKVIALTGGGDDIEDVDQERRQELDAAEELGLSFETDPQPSQEPAADTTDQPPPDDSTDETPQRLRAIR